MIKESLNSLKKGLKEGLDWTGTGLLIWTGTEIYNGDIKDPINGESFNYKDGILCPAVGIASGIVCKGIASIL